MSTRTFSRDWLERHRINQELSNPLVVHREMAERREYGTVYQVVIKADGKFWRLRYLETDLGEIEQDAWFHEEDVPAQEVQGVLSLTHVWLTVRSEPVPVPGCKPILPDGSTDRCGGDAAWSVVYRANGSNRKTDLCEHHLHDGLRLRTDLVDIREVRRVE